MAFAEDLSPFLADFGVAANLNGSAVTAVVDTSSEDVDGIVTQGPSALMTSAASAAAAPGQTFVASGVTYNVRQVLKEPPDGAFTRLVLVRV